MIINTSYNVCIIHTCIPAYLYTYYSTLHADNISADNIIADNIVTSIDVHRSMYAL